jgi:hypothetical protein
MEGHPVTSTYPRGTVEYVKATVTADVALTMTVQIALTNSGSTHTWLPAEWTGSSGTMRTARTSSAVTFDVATYPKSTYQVYVKLTDAPEAPIIRAGQITIS